MAGALHQAYRTAADVNPSITIDCSGPFFCLLTIKTSRVWTESTDGETADTSAGAQVTE